MPARVRWHTHGLNNAFIFRTTCFGVSRIPASLSYAIGHVGTYLAFRLMREGTEALVANLRVVCPELDDEGLRTLALKTYRNYAADTIDYIRGVSGGRRLLSRHQCDRELFDRARQEGRGVILVTGHIGNWEIGAALLSVLHGLPVTVVGMPEPDEAVGRARRRLRDSVGVETVEVGLSVATPLQVRRRLAENRIVAMLFDRHVGRDRVEVQMFGRPTQFLRAPALLGALTGAPLLPSFVLRQADGRVMTVTKDPIWVDPTADSDEGTRRAMQALASLLEAEIRKRPDLWYQFYPYWS